MIYQCQKCGLSKSDSAMGSVLPQCKCDWQPTPLMYKPAREWVGLTDEEITTIWRQSEHLTVNQVCRAIEAKLREKNL